MTLWLKEVPFLLSVAATQMQHEDLRRHWQAEYALAQTLGRTPAQALAQIIWPQLAPSLRWPLLAVLAWQWLSDAYLLTQSQGVAAGWLTGTVLVSGVFTVVVLRLVGATRTFASRNSLPQNQATDWQSSLSWKTSPWVVHLCRRLHLQPNLMWTTLLTTYAAVWFALCAVTIAVCIHAGCVRLASTKDKT